MSDKQRAAGPWHRTRSTLHSTSRITRSWLRPSVDGWLYPADVHSVYRRGEQHRVPLLIGSNADEDSIFSDVMPMPETRSDYEEAMRQMRGDSAAALVAAYSADTDDDAGPMFAASFADHPFGWQMRTWARLASESGDQAVFLYHFRRAPAGLRAEQFGAYHAAEILYAFSNISNEEARSGLEVPPVEAAAVSLDVGSRCGHYDVTALIGEGGMDQVYRATDTKLNRQVAHARTVT